MALGNVFVWTGTLGNDWWQTSGTLSNWVCPTDPSLQQPIPGFLSDNDVAEFNSGSPVSIADTEAAGAGGCGINNGTTVTFSSGSFGFGFSDTDSPLNLSIDSNGTLIVGSGVSVADRGEADVVGVSGVGSLQIQPGGGFDDYTMFVGDSPGGSGDITVDAATFEVAQSGSGTPSDGVLTIGNLGDGTVDVSGGSLFFAATVIVGAEQGAIGNLTVDGSIWGGSNLTVGQSGTGNVSVTDGSTVALTSILIGPSGDLSVSAIAGLTSTVMVPNLTLAFGRIDVSGGGEVAVGTSGVPGAVAVGGTLVGLGTINANVVLTGGGTVEAIQALPGKLKINGNITGTGTIEPLMTLEANGVIGAGVEIAFSPPVGGPEGQLVLDVPRGDQGTITGFSAGNSIAVEGLVYSNAVFAPGTSGNPGTLTLSGGTAAQPLVLAVQGNYAAGAFVATPRSVDTIVTLGPPPPPVLSSAPNQIIEAAGTSGAEAGAVAAFAAAGPAGAVATFSVTATDLIDGTDPVVFKEGGNVVQSGGFFSVGTHTITASATDSLAHSSQEAFTINVQSSNVLTSNPGEVDALIGSSANDVFVVHNSADTVSGVPGSSDVVYSDVDFTLPANVDTLVLFGSQGTGNSDASGDGLYAANPGITQTLNGNSANDTFVVYNQSDVVVPKAGSHDVVYAAASYTLPTGVDILILEAGTEAVGNSDAAGDALYAANPNQVATLIGNSLNDTFVVYNSADVVVPQAGSHDLVYSAVNYTLPTGVDALILEAGTQAVGNSDAAGDTLYAANAGIAQTLTGHSHNDTFVAYNSGDIVIGQAGSTDTVYAAANFTLPNNVDRLFLEGNASRGTGNNDAVDALFGNGSVASTLVAGSGADTLYVTGTAGTILTGGAGHDTFAFPNVMGHDEVTNFGVAKNTLQFNMTLFSNFTAAMNHASQSGANTVFTIDANDTVTLDNVTKTSLTASNFHFT